MVSTILICRRCANFIGTKNCSGEKRSGESEGGQKFLPPTPFLFARLSGKVIIKIQSPDFRQKSSDFNQKVPNQKLHSKVEFLIRKTNA